MNSLLATSFVLADEDELAGTMLSSDVFDRCSTHMCFSFFRLATRQSLDPSPPKHDGESYTFPMKQP